MTRRLYIETVGCQMNVLDSELIVEGLLGSGYELVDDPRRADVILFNTCSVRRHAEDKIYSALGRLKHVKEHHPSKIIGVLGCMAQKDGSRIFRRAPHVDLVVGSGRLGRLPELLERIAAGAGPQVEISRDRGSSDVASVRRSFTPYDPPRRVEARAAAHQAMVRIMSGCDRFCAYCVVPGVRGPEQHRPVGRIEEEVRRLADRARGQGVCLEVTLLGQTVNRYRDESEGRTVRLEDLLRRLNEIEGLTRLKFVTNHPRYMTDALIEAVGELPKVSPYLHVPAQSGSDRVLRRMRRGYTVGEYREMLARICRTIPEAAITSDFIVGFCSETEEDFQRTVALVRHGRFKNSFIFKYSTRPGTPSAEQYADDVPYKVKQRRNNELLAVQNAISLEDNQPFVGRTVEILVEGPSKTARKHARTEAAGQLVGRTVCDRIVVFDGPEELTGRLVRVTIEKAGAYTLFGRNG